MALFLEKCPKFTCEGKCEKSCSTVLWKVKIKKKKVVLSDDQSSQYLLYRLILSLNIIK